MSGLPIRGSVLVVGAHATSGRSMHRHAALLADAWSELADDVRLLTPASPISSRLAHPGAAKWAGYVEKFVLFVPTLRRVARDVELVHVADHSDALWVLLLARRTETAVTVHDLFAVQAAAGRIVGHPPVKVAGRLYQRLVLRGLTRTGRLVAVSCATAEEVQQVVGRACGVVPNPLDPGLVKRAVPVIGLACRPYFLMVGAGGWRKRREQAIRVWLRLRQTAHYAGAGLVVVGPGLTTTELALLPDDRDSVQVVAGATDDALRSFYAGCVAVLVLSSHEGFGWPVIEANAQGRPAICSDIPVLREVGGCAAIYITDDLEQTDWCDTARALGVDWAHAAHVNTSRFSWSLFVSAIASAFGVLPATHERDVAARRKRRPALPAGDEFGRRR